jgi:CRISPR type I-E-associated protein CasB/Cse2
MAIDAGAFIGALRQLDDQATALLRHSILREPGTDPRAMSIVEPLIGDADGWEREACYLVAALRAQLPGNPARSAAWSFGTSYGRYVATIVPARRRGEAERRFEALLDCYAGEDLPRHLRHEVALVQRAGIPVGWVRLLGDLIRWDEDDRPVQRRWMEDQVRAVARADYRTAAAGGDDA